MPCSPTTLALIISTYNWPEALELVLLSILAQSQQPDEIIIADDGSGADTAALIKKYQAQFSAPVKHIWHEDKGFRLAEIRNKAIAHATSNYIVQVDGDIILHCDFIKDHSAFARPGTFVRASRIYINQEITTAMLQKKCYKVNAFSKGVSNFFSALRLPMLWPMFAELYKNRGDERWEIHGCNMAFWKADAIAVNGYDEKFRGWGPEDKEFVARLINNGLKKRFIKLGAIAFHLFHPVSSKSCLAENEKAFRETIRLQKNRCEFGINQYL